MHSKMPGDRLHTLNVSSRVLGTSNGYVPPFGHVLAQKELHQRNGLPQGHSGAVRAVRIVHSGSQNSLHKTEEGSKETCRRSRR